MIIDCTNLAMRFYAKEGWSQELVESYMVKKGPLHHFEEGELNFEYWIPYPQTAMDCKKLVADGHTIQDYFPQDHVGWSIERILEEKN